MSDLTQQQKDCADFARIPPNDRGAIGTVLGMMVWHPVVVRLMAKAVRSHRRVEAAERRRPALDAQSPLAKRPIP